MMNSTLRQPYLVELTVSQLLAPLTMKALTMVRSAGGAPAHCGPDRDPMLLAVLISAG
jgi:hypothetical protein